VKSKLSNLIKCETCDDIFTTEEEMRVHQNAEHERA
jgi:hypothetical protein